MFFKKVLVLVFAVFVFCESAFVDNLNKCEINDGKCQKNLIQSLVTDISKRGVPELEIPVLDPIQLKNVSVSILDVLDITLVEGTAKGVKDCIVQKVVTNIEKRRASIELICDLSLKGQYKVFSSSPLIKSLIGGDTVQGEGNGKVKIEKLYLKLDFYFIVRKENGDYFLNCEPEKTTYMYDLKGKMTFFADNLYIGKQESSKLVTGLLNQNVKLLMTSFGKPFMDKAMVYIYEFLHKFFDKVAAKYYIVDDLSPYVTNK